MNFQTWIETNLVHDKCLHALFGYAICAFVFVLSYIAGASYALSLFVSVVATAVAAVSKETADKFCKKTKFDVVDILYTMLGTLPTLVVIIVIFLYD